MCPPPLGRPRCLAAPARQHPPACRRFTHSRLPSPRPHPRPLHPRSTLDSNSLSGGLPAAWGAAGAFPQLQRLSLSAAGLGGELPRGWGADGGLPSLVDLLIDRNAFKGRLPREWAAPGRLPKLNQL